MGGGGGGGGGLFSVKCHTSRKLSDTFYVRVPTKIFKKFTKNIFSDIVLRQKNVDTITNAK